MARPRKTEEEQPQDAVEETAEAEATPPVEETPETPKQEEGDA